MRYPEDHGKPCIVEVSEGRPSGLLLPDDLADWIGAVFGHCLVQWCYEWAW
jgi:hypothetical protein